MGWTLRCQRQAVNPGILEGIVKVISWVIEQWTSDHWWKQTIWCCWTLSKMSLGKLPMGPACEICSDFAWGISFNTIFKLTSGGFPSSGETYRWWKVRDHALLKIGAWCWRCFTYTWSAVVCIDPVFRGFVVMIALKRNASQYFREDLHPNCLVEERSLGKLVSGAQAWEVNGGVRYMEVPYMDYKAMA